MKRIIATILAGSLSALTLAAAPAHADEGRAYDQQGSQQRYDQGDEYQQNRDRRGGDVTAYRHESVGDRAIGATAATLMGATVEGDLMAIPSRIHGANNGIARPAWASGLETSKST